MGLLDWYDDHRKPSYYTFRLMVETLDGFADCTDVSFDDVRTLAFALATGGRAVYVLWNASEEETPVDASEVLGNADVLVTRIVTALDEAGAPIVAPPETVPSTALPVSITPIFVEPL